MALPFFEKRPTRAISLRQQAEALYAQLRDAQAARTVVSTNLRGQHTERKGGSGHDFWQYRDFQSGDHARAIDWKQSGKSDRLLIRQKEQETQQKTVIWLQNDAAMHFGDPEKYDTGAIITLVMAMLCARHHDPLKLSGAGVLSIDALTSVLGDAAFAPNNNDLSGEEIFLIGDFLAPAAEILAAFSSIPGERRVHLVQILAGVELDLPFAGRVIFEAPSLPDKEEVLNVADLRQAYQEKLHRHLASIETLARQQNWSYSLIRSGDDLLIPLIKILQRGDHG